MWLQSKSTPSKDAIPFLNENKNVKFLPVDCQGPVVQSIVSLTSSFRGQLVKCFRTL